MDRSALFESDACVLPGSFPSTGFQIRKQANFAGNNALRSIAPGDISQIAGANKGVTLADVQGLADEGQRRDKLEELLKLLVRILLMCVVERCE